MISQTLIYLYWSLLIALYPSAPFLTELLEESREAVSNLKKENLNLMAEVQASKTRVQIIQQESEKLRDVSSKAEVGYLYVFFCL